MNPAGAARFWGTFKQDKNLQRMSTGDIAVFTGDKAVRGIGEIGVLFKYPEFGDLLWPPHSDDESWRNVYNLRAFQPLEVPNTEIYALPGFTTQPHAFRACGSSTTSEPSLSSSISASKLRNQLATGLRDHR